MTYSAVPTLSELDTFMSGFDSNNATKRNVQGASSGIAALKQPSYSTTNILDFVDEVDTSGKLIFEQSNACMEALLVLLENVTEVKEDGEIIIEGFEEFRKEHLIIETVEGDVSIYKRHLVLPSILDYLTEVSADGKLSFKESHEYTKAILELLENVIKIKEDGEIIIDGYGDFSKHYKVMQNERGTETIYLRNII